MWSCESLVGLEGRGRGRYVGKRVRQVRGGVGTVQKACVQSLCCRSFIEGFLFRVRALEPRGKLQ